VHSISNSRDMGSLSGRICSCTICPLSISRKNAVPGEGPVDATIMLVGEAPGRDEDQLGRPFAGRAGAVLSRSLEAAGIDRQALFITNVVKCRPPENRRPLASEIQACLPYLHRQMELVQPRIVCLLGNVPCNALLGCEGVTKMRGRLYQDRYFVTFHPAAVLRNRNLEMLLISDFRQIASL